MAHQDRGNFGIEATNFGFEDRFEFLEQDLMDFVEGFAFGLLPGEEGGLVQPGQGNDLQGAFGQFESVGAEVIAHDKTRHRQGAIDI